MGPEVGAIAAKLGKPLMPWQQLVADVALEQDADGRLVYREVVVHVMRQQGKTTLQLPVMTHRCLRGPQLYGVSQHVSYAAQSGVAARKKLLEEHAPMLRDSPFGPYATPRRQSGHEAIHWRNGSRHTIMTGTEKSGHGDVLDQGVIDEAFAYVDPRLEQAMIPAMQTRPDPQLWVMSTAGTEKSSYLRSKVNAGRARVEAGLTDLTAYFEWSFAADEDPFDPATWRLRMPALGHTVSERAVSAAAASMDNEAEFCRAFGNMWPDMGGLSVFDMATWGALAVERGFRTPETAPFALAFSVSPDQKRSSISAATRLPDGRAYLELIQADDGTAWVVPRLLEIVKKRKPCAIGVDPSTQAGALLPAFANSGVEIIPITKRQNGQACGGLFEAVNKPAVLHISHPLLNQAADAGRKRKIGDSGLWEWAWTDLSTDITPLASVTIARLMLELHGATPPKSKAAFGF